MIPWLVEQTLLRNPLVRPQAIYCAQSQYKATAHVDLTASSHPLLVLPGHGAQEAQHTITARAGIQIRIIWAIVLSQHAFP